MENVHLHLLKYLGFERGRTVESRRMPPFPNIYRCNLLNFGMQYYHVFFICFSIKVYLYMQPDSGEAQEDKQAALNLVKRRKQLHSEGLSSTQNRYAVGDNTKNS